MDCLFWWQLEMVGAKEMMTQAEKLSAFWWGRILPREYRHLSSKSPHRMSDDDVDTLSALKYIVEEGERLGVHIPFGKQVTIEDLKKLGVYS